MSHKVIGTTSGTPKDEMHLAMEALSRLSGEKESAIGFINAVGNGNLDVDQTSYGFTADGDDSLGTALLKMRDQLKEISDKERERTWVTERLADFSELFRTNTESLPELCNIIISKLVKYLNANQAAIFVTNDEQKDAVFLELLACYAYDRRKYLNKQIGIGEGLLGQTFLEKEILYMTDIPQGYTSITSGLGDATPTCLLIVPIKHNEKVLGMLEIASFKELQHYQIEFVEKMSEGIAAAISSTKIREHTSKLLFESQKQTEELKAQEEEMRQNMEELQATQEASLRLQEELRLNEQKQREKIEELNQAKQIMQEQEEKLKASQAKAQSRSLKFKEKMEQLDFELEGKNALIKTLTKELEQMKEKISFPEEKILSNKNLHFKLKKQYERNGTQVC